MAYILELIMELYYSTLGLCYDKHGHLLLIEGAYCEVHIIRGQLNIGPMHWGI